MLPGFGNGSFPGEEFFNSFYPIAFAICIGFVVGLRAYLRGGEYLGKENLNGKVAIITGANSGIGLETAKAFVFRGCKVILACKTIEKGELAAKEIREIFADLDVKIIPMILDLSSFKSIKSFANKFLKEEKILDILVNNAGLMCHPFLLTEDKLEIHFQVNFLGHFLLTKLLENALSNSLSPKVINTTAHAYRIARPDILSDINFEQSAYNAGDAYAYSKLAVLLSTIKLSEISKESKICYYSVNPGVVSTNLHRHMPFRKNAITAFFMAPIFWFLMKGPKDGAQNTLKAVLDPLLDCANGKYLVNLKIEDPELPQGYEILSFQLYQRSIEIISRYI